MQNQRASERPFDVIPYEDIQGNWKKLGSGSFGNVYKGTYLGIDVAIKEVLPSTEYDVSKYFEREWRLMKECRHPNVVLYLGLSRAPDPDGRIFIISEFIENGNLRAYIHDKNKMFPWRMRISFATDIARALAYLHARKCIHRDLKGENLLITANGRLKVTDFGFARIAARNEEEMKRLTFCGTDSYMSPEILLGEEFDLPTDVFSMGVIFCEILARKLADDRSLKRAAPTFTMDEMEVRKLASPGCPDGFIELALDCMKSDPASRPNMISVLARLRDIELEILQRPTDGEDAHVGSLKFATGFRRPPAAPRIPSFGQGVGQDIRMNGANDPQSGWESSDDDSDEEVVETIKAMNIQVSDGLSNEPLLGNTETAKPYSPYSTSVVRSHSPQASYPMPPSLSSILTIRTPDPNAEANPMGTTRSLNSIDSIGTINSFHTALSSAPSTISVAGATEGGSTIRTSLSSMVHRFTIIKPGARRSASPPTAGSPARSGAAAVGQGASADQKWSPFGFFSSGLSAKCDLCDKKLGFKPVLECDDCGLRAHVKCGETAPMDCGLRPERLPAAQSFLPLTSSPVAMARQMVKGSPYKQ